jgi:signal transduction histidine kinase
VRATPPRRIRAGLRRRLFLPFVALGALAIFVLAAIARERVASDLSQHAKARGEALTHAVEYAAETLRSRADLQRFVTALGAEPDVISITVTQGATATVVAATRGSWIGEPLPVAARGPVPTGLPRDGAMRIVHDLRLASEIHGGEATSDGDVYVEIDVSAVSRESAATSAFLAIGLAAGLLAIAAICAILVARVVLRPMHRIETAMERRASGVLDARADVLADDEIGALAATLNSMLDEIARRVAEIETGKAKIGAQAELLELQAAELRSARDTALAATRSKSEFLAAMSHEIRTPLNGVLGISNLLLTTQLSADQRELLGTARSSGEALLHILDDVLDLSKVEAGRLDVSNEDVVLETLVDEVALLFHGKASEKGLLLFTSLDPALPERVTSDPHRLRQCLLNLTGNAVKFTASGHVGLRVRIVAGAAPRLRFEVDDSGIGVDAAAAERLFKPFAQAGSDTSRRFGGTGLGLAITRSLAERMGGTAGCKGEPGRGSTFWFEIALVIPAAAQPLQARYERLRGRRVALRLASPVLAASLRRDLVAAGLEVVAEGAAAALDFTIDDAPGSLDEPRLRITGGGLEPSEVAAPIRASRIFQELSRRAGGEVARAQERPRRRPRRPPNDYASSWSRTTR